jgi:uncharacterized damage-inducible protein DinB
MIRSIDDFAAAWADESEKTQKVLDALTDASLAQKVAPSGRSLGFIAWHIVTTITEMLPLAGVATRGPDPKAPVPKSAREIADAYKKAASSVVPALKNAWKDAQLAEEIPMYGMQWPRAKVLSALLLHEAHHRGQATVLMRQAGVVVPGTYGPAREDWSKMGMAAQP